MSQNPNRLETVLSNGYNFQLSQYISKGFNIFGKNAGMFIGYLLVYFAISIGLSIIPILGQLASLVISGALLAGYYIVADKTERGEHVEFSNFFDGFKSLTPLFIGTLLLIVMAIALMIPFFIIVFFKFGIESLSGDGSFPDFGILDFIVIAAVFIGVLYISVSFIYMTLFIVFDKMDAWAAMMASRKIVEKNFILHVLFFIVWGFIIMLSALPFGLGLLATIPAFYCSVYAAWADITDFYNEPSEEDDIMRHLID